MKKLSKNQGLALLIGLYMAFNIFFLVKYQNFLALWLNWNLVLAILPLILVKLGKRSILKKRPLGLTIVLLLASLFFFPNSLYMVTDYIHLQNSNFYSIKVLETGQYEIFKSYETIYSSNIEDWIQLISTSMAFLISSYLGLKSLDLFLNEILVGLNKGLKTLILVAIASLSSIGIYIGRFLRFNSWDIFKPLSLVKSLVESLEGFSYSFILLFTVYTLFIYSLYKLIKNPEN